MFLVLTHAEELRRASRPDAAAALGSRRSPACSPANAVVSELVQARPGSRPQRGPGRRRRRSGRHRRWAGLVFRLLRGRSAGGRLRVGRPRERRRDPEPGDLLVASALLTDGVFDQTVVLVLDSDEDGALGVILNEISQTHAGVRAAGLGAGGLRAASCCSTAGRCRRTGRSAWPAWPEPGEEPPGWRPLFDRVGPAAPGHPDRDRRGARTPTCASSPATPVGRRASWPVRSPSRCGTWSRPTTTTCSAAGRRGCGVRVLRRQKTELAFLATWVGRTSTRTRTPRRCAVSTDIRW